VAFVISLVGWEQRKKQNLKGNVFSVLNIFFFWKRSQSAPGRAAEKYWPTRGLRDLSVIVYGHKGDFCLSFSSCLSSQF